MTSRQKRWYAEQGIDWREVEDAKRKPVEAVEVAPAPVPTARRRRLPAIMLAASALGSGVPDMPKSTPKPWGK